MPITIEGAQYHTNAEVSGQLKISRQTLWRWRERGCIPAGLRYRTRQVLFTAAEVEAIRHFANRLVPIELGQHAARHLELLGRASQQEKS